MRLLRHGLGALGCALLMSACLPPVDGSPGTDGGQSSTTDGGQPPVTGEDGGTDVGQAGDVKGVMRSRYISASGVEEVRADFTDAEVAASMEVLSLDPLSGDFTTIPLTAGADGAFTFKDVPAGPYYLRRNSTWYVTSRRQLDFTSDILGRRDARTASAGTVLNLSLQGLQAWQVTDDLMMVAPNAGWDYYSMSLMGGVLDVPEDGTPIADGATQATVSLDYSEAVSGPQLVEAAKGDTLYVMQLSTQAGPGDSLVVGATRGAAIDTLTMADGTTTSVSATLEQLPPTALTLDFRYSQFEGLLKEAFPTGEGAEGDIYVDVMPYGAEYGTFAGAADIARFYLPPGGTDVSVPVSFGDPFPAPWLRRVTASGGIWQRTELEVGGQTSGRWDYLSVHTAVDLADASAPLRPLVGPIRALKLDGQDASQSRNDVGTSPRVSWSAPEAGTAHGYSVYVHRLSPSTADASALARTTVAAFHLRDTHLTIPPGVLTAGENYRLHVRAYYEPGLTDRDANPWKSAPLPTGRADFYSAVFRP